MHDTQQSEMSDFESTQYEAQIEVPEYRGSRSWGTVIAIIVLLAMVGAGAYSAPKILDTLSGSETDSGALLHTVSRGELLVTVTEDGNLESASNVDVKCKISGGSTILWIVEDGSHVKKDDDLVRLDDSSITEQLNLQTIAFEKALAAKVQAEEDLAAAELAVDEYVKGTFEKELQDAEALVKIGQENLRSYQNLLKHTEKMTRKGFATPLQLEADEFAVERAELQLKSAEKARDVLVEYTKEKTKRDLIAKQKAAEALVRSETEATKLEKNRLERLRKQLDFCLVKAPADGMVVYANQNGRRSSQPEIEEGAAVRERQTLIRLPALDEMQVKVKVHESKIDQIKPGMEAVVQVLDTRYTGKVVSVANQPEPGMWYQAQVKEYAAIIDIDHDQSDLKPGMTAESEIIISQLDDVVKVPVVAVVEKRGKYYAWVFTPTGQERRTLILGQTNDQDFEVIDGVAVGEQVYLNPRAIIEDARAEEDADAEAVEKTTPKAKRSGEKTEKPTTKDKKPTSDSKDSDAPANSSDTDQKAPAAAAQDKASPKEATTDASPNNSIEKASAESDNKAEDPKFLPPGTAKPIEDAKPATKQQENAATFESVDTNGDGFISDEEKTAARKKLLNK